MPIRRYRRRALPWVSAIGLGLILAVSAALGHNPRAVHAQESNQGLPFSEKEAQSIDRMLMCPVCVGVTIDQSPVEVARQMRATVRDLLGNGVSRGEVSTQSKSRGLSARTRLCLPLASCSTRPSAAR